MGKTHTLIVGIFASSLARGLSVVVPIITVPLALTALGTVGYGAWAAALALTTFVTFADLGLGAGLMTLLPGALGKGDRALAREYVSSAYFALILITGVALICIWSPLDWAGLVGAGNSNEIGQIVRFTFSGFALNIVALLVGRVQQAVQSVARSYLWQALGSASSLGGLCLISFLGVRGSIFVAVAALTPPLVGILNTLVFFGSSGRYLLPSRQSFRWSTALSLIRFGSKFLLIWLMMSVSLGTDAWVIGQAIGLESVPAYAIPARVFAVLGTVVTMITMPLWPVGASAFASGDIVWIRTTVRKMTVICPALSGILSATAVLVGPAVFSWWLKGEISVDTTLLVGLALWNFSQSLAGPALSVQNAAGLLRPQLVAYAFMLVTVPVKWYVVRLFGSDWAPYVNLFTYGLTIWPAAFFGYKKIVRRYVDFAPVDDDRQGV